MIQSALKSRTRTAKVVGTQEIMSFAGTTLTVSLRRDSYVSLADSACN